MLTILQHVSLQSTLKYTIAFDPSQKLVTSLVITFFYR